MKNQFLSHDLEAEFPDLTSRVEQLQRDDGNFARLYDQFHAVDANIIKAEKQTEPMNDFALEDLKKRRLKLKDELYQIIKAS